MGRPMSRHGGASPDGDDVAKSRVNFLSADAVPADRVRGSIFASWRRSREMKVAADKIEMPYVRDPDVDTELTRSAEPVLRSLREQLDGQAVSIVLTDPTGLVVRRMTADHELERHLDGVLLAPGFSYAERFVGTNGIGTALEVGGPAHVFGHEHYAENLEDLACAGVPISHPISGRTVGAIDLTCWRKDAGALLLTLAKTTAEQIRQALLADTGASQLGLFQEYLRTCHRMSGVVFALNKDVVMLNDYARAVLDPTDQAALLAQAAEPSPWQHGPIAVRLPTGLTARMHGRPVLEGGQPAGVVVHVKLDDDSSLLAAGRDLPPPMLLPGLVGGAPIWLHTCQEVERVFRSGEWLAVEGETGVGKLALLRAVQLRRQPVGRFVVLDSSEGATDPRWLEGVRFALSDGSSTVVFRHVEELDPRRLRELSSTLQDAGGRKQENRPWVAITIGHGAQSTHLHRLLRLFPSTVQVPPLRLHLEDLPLLVSFFLARLGHGGQLTCAPEAMRMLMRQSWPGNVEQVHQVLRQVVKRRRAGQIQPSDLPPEARTVSRRRLSPLESMERDAIVQSLLDANGSKAQAARSLEMSRATIYRKIHEYGIVDSIA
jgi:transcriptional regulator of acetoin/glycerol metabolism